MNSGPGALLLQRLLVHSAAAGVAAARFFLAGAPVDGCTGHGGMVVLHAQGGGCTLAHMGERNSKKECGVGRPLLVACASHGVIK